MTPALQDGPVTVYHGDALDVLREMPDESVHCVISSPPYWGLRDYGTASWVGGDEDCDHLGNPVATSAGFNARYFDKPYEDGKQGEKRHPFRDTCGKCGARRVDSQLGLEATPEEYVANMVRLFREVRRVLRADGTCWLNLGDSYAAGGMSNPSPKSTLGGAKDRGAADYVLSRLAPPGLKPKDLVMIPARVALALQSDGWYLRCDIIWSKPNPMPESVTDRPTTSHEHVFLLTKSPRYFYDADAVREDVSLGTAERYRYAYKEYAPGVQHHGSGFGTAEAGEIDAARGRNLRSVWTIATQPYSEAHFATYPEALVLPCIKAGTSERGCCPDCGAPWRRMVEMTEEYRALLDSGKAWRTSDGKPDEYTNRQPKDHPANVPTKNRTTGWEPTCGHSANIAPVPCTVLDPFAGSGTTLAVARRLGRRSIGIELSQSYIDTLIRPRVQGSALPLLEYLQEAGE